MLLYRGGRHRTSGAESCSVKVAAGPRNHKGPRNAPSVRGLFVSRAGLRPSSRLDLIRVGLDHPAPPGAEVWS